MVTNQMIQQMPILIGQFLITDNRQEVYNLLSSNAPDLRFIDLEDIDQALPANHPAVLGGNQILPPVDSLIAEQDGRPDLYFDNYQKLLLINQHNRQLLVHHVF